jgi:uncharacterized protein
LAQRQWVENRDACETIDCVDFAYNERLQELRFEDGIGWYAPPCDDEIRTGRSPIPEVAPEPAPNTNEPLNDLPEIQPF